MGDNSGSTPGNPHTVEGRGLTFPRMPNNIPAIRRSAKCLRGAAGTGEKQRRQRARPSVHGLYTLMKQRLLNGSFN